MVIFIIIWEDYTIVIKGSVVMKMAYKISVAVIVLLSMALLALPAAAQFGPGFGACGAPCGGPVAYGPPQDCIATIACNIPVTTQVPIMTTTVVPQTVPVTVPVQSVCPVTVPRVVVVPETVPVPVVTPALSSITVPVTVPVPSSVPVTSLVPQCYTVPLGCAGGAPMAPNMPYGGIPKGANLGLGSNLGLGKGLGSNLGMGKGLGAGMGIPAAY